MVGHAVSGGFFRTVVAKREQILALFTRKEYASEDYVFFEGDVPCRLWFVVEGRVKLLKHSDMGKDVIVTVVSAGRFLGELVVRGGGPCTVTAQAIGPTVMLTMTPEAYVELLHRFPDVALFIIDSLGARLNEAYDTIRSLAVERVERRIARLLLEAGRFGRAGVRPFDPDRHAPHPAGHRGNDRHDGRERDPGDEQVPQGRTDCLAQRQAVSDGTALPGRDRRRTPEGRRVRAGRRRRRLNQASRPAWEPGEHLPLELKQPNSVWIRRSFAGLRLLVAD